jgi:hypothetical protein
LASPHIPIKSNKEEVKETVIKFKTIKKSNPHEYNNYKKIVSKGIDGITATKVTIELSDGVEVSRAAPVSTTKQPAVDEVIEVGVREMPQARFTKIRDMPNGFMNRTKGKYIVEGTSTPNQKVSLYQNNKKVGTTKTNKDGYFEFSNLSKGVKPSWLVLHDRDKKKLSEKTRAIFTTKELKTEYEIYHTVIQ